MKEQKQKQLAWYVWWLCIIALFVGIIVQLVIADCLPCCPDVIGGGCPGNLAGVWDVCCTKYSSYGHIHIGCCDYDKFKINCMGGGTAVLYVLEARHFNDPDYIWVCVSTNTQGWCHKQSRSIVSR